MSSLCERCEMDREDAVHLPKEECRFCQAPQEHHAFVGTEVVLTRWDMEDLAKGRALEKVVYGRDFTVRLETQEEEDATA